MFISVFSIYFVLLSPFDHVWVYWSVLWSLGGQELLSFGHWTICGSIGFNQTIERMGDYRVFL